MAISFNPPISPHRTEMDEADQFVTSQSVNDRAKVVSEFAQAKLNERVPHAKDHISSINSLTSKACFLDREIGTDLDELEDLHDSEEMLEQLLDKDPDSIYTMMALGKIWGKQAYFSRGLEQFEILDKAKDLYLEVLDVNPDSIFAKMDLGEVLIRQAFVWPNRKWKEAVLETLKEAERIYRKILIEKLSLSSLIDAKMGLVEALRTQSYFYQVGEKKLLEKLNEAETISREILIIDHKNVAAMRCLGDILKKQSYSYKGDDRLKRLNEAEDIFQTVLKIDSKSVFAMTGLGEVKRMQAYFCHAQASLRMLNEAEDIFQTVLKIDSDSVLAKKGLDEVLRMKANFHPAQETIEQLNRKEDIYRRALEIDPENTYAKEGLEEVFWEKVRKKA
ncbi:MAG: hypothetical protein WAM28_08770 [Chlamydiales bacterium]